MDSGGSGLFHRDGGINLCDQAPYHGAGQDQEGGVDHVDDGNHQEGGGEGEEGRGERVGDGQLPGRTGRKPAKWVVPMRRGIVK